MHTESRDERFWSGYKRAGKFWKQTRELAHQIKYLLFCITDGLHDM